LRLPACRAIGDALLDQFADAVKLHLGHDGADVNRFVEWRTDAQGAHTILNLRGQSFGDALLHQQARARATHLALIEPDSVNQAFHGAIEVGVFKDDERRLAAEFKR